MTNNMKKSEKLAISVLIVLCLGFIIGMLTSCVSKHPKCAAYDNIQKIEK